MEMEPRALFLQARSLLRSLDDVIALGENGLTSRAVSNMRSLGLSDDAIAREIAELVQRAMDRLTPRERRIVEGREVHKHSDESVYASLALSRRQYFRIRRAALIKIARSVAGVQHASNSGLSNVRSGGKIRMIEAAAQYQLGLTRASLGSLRFALSESVDSLDRFDAAISIARLYANEGSYRETRRYLAEARSSLTDIHHERPLRALMLDMLTLESAWYYNDRTLDVPREIERMESSSVALMRFALNREDAGIIVETLAGLAEIRFERGEVDRAGAVLSLCMGEVARQPELGGRSLYRALSAAAMMSMVLSDGLPNAADYYAQAYRNALERNALRDAVVAAACLCSIWRVAGMSQRAIAAAPAILDRARRVCAGPVFAGIALDFAAAMIDVGASEGVAPLIAEAATHTQAATFDSSLAAFLKARHLQRHDHLRDALSLVNEALLGFRAAKRRVHEGAALRIQAELQSRLGHRRDAATNAGDALSILTQYGSPYALERAYRTSAHVTGNSEHRRLAYEIQAERARDARRLSADLSVELT